jgi:hypothetical protein
MYVNLFKPQEDSMFHSEKLALVLALGLIPAASFADVKSGGESTTGNILVDAAVDESTDDWEILETESFTLSASSDIVVTACSDFDNPGGAAPNTYLYDIEIDTNLAGLNSPTERTIDDLYNDPAKDDPDLVAVCTTRFFSNVAVGSHDIHVVAAKASPAMLNVTVLDTSMTLVATEGTEL